jgi:hypothetical protein
MEERKVLERARGRRQVAEEKVELTRKWGAIAHREAIEYKGRANQLNELFDANLPRAIAEIDRVLTTLESYAAVNYQARQAILVADQASAPENTILTPDHPAPRGDLSQAQGSEESDARRSL